MKWHALGVGLALFLVLEGVLPFLSPHRVRGLLERLATLNDNQLRFAGLTSMLLGLLLLYAMNA